MTMWAAQGPVSSSDLYEVDPTDGSTISVGSIGEGVTGMAVDPTNGTLYGVTSGASNNPRRLITIDTNTGAGSIVGQLLQGGTPRNISDIGFDSTGQLWGFNVSQSRICQINKATGALTNVGSTNLSGGGNAIDLDWQDDLFWMGDQSSGLLRQVDTSTGVPTDISTLDDITISDNIPAAAFSGDKLYAIVQDSPSWFVTVAWTGHVTFVAQMSLNDIDALASDVVKTQWYQPPVELNAEDYANLSSPTVSLTPDTPDWVRDEQYREYDFVNFDTSKGTFDYTPSIIIPAGTVVAGKWRLELYSRHGSIGGANTEQILVQIEQGGEKLNPIYGNGLPTQTDGTASYRPITDETGTSTLALGNGGPLYVDSSKEIKIAFGQTSEDESSVGVPRRYLEVQKIRFFPVDMPDPPARRWINMYSGGEPWPFFIEGQIRCRAHPNGTTFYSSGHYFNNVAGGDGRFSIWEYNLTGDQITLIDSKGLGDVDLFEVPGNAIFWHDFTVMPNGDIYLIAFEQGTSSEHRLWLKHWNGSSWNTITTDVAGVGVGNNWWRYSCSIDNDGTDVYMAWGQHKNGGLSYSADDWVWRVKKYDVGGASFSEFGSSSGQSAYPANWGTARNTLDGNGQYPVKLRISPNGVTWIAWNQYDVASGATFPDANDRPHIWYWDGAAWQDTGSPTPTPAPTVSGSHTYSETPSVGQNYSRLVSDDVDAVSLVFCNTDGPSENPSVLFQYNWNDQVGNFDYSEFAYFEWNGATWGNQQRGPSFDVWPAIPFVSHPTDLQGGHWHAGFAFTHDGTQPVVFAQLGQLSSSLMAVAAAKITDTGFQAIGGDESTSYANAITDGWINFVDYPSNPSPFSNGENWIDSAEPGLMVGSRYVGQWNWPNGWLNLGTGLMMSIWKEAGGAVSMNWRSSDRRGSANRVLVGDR